MKPNFALDLSHDGINLLHRGKGGWTLVGSAALDDPGLALRLTELRKTAAQLESGGFTTKLIIPNSQILYTTVEAPGPDDIAREVQIRAALDGLTPYPVGDLVFDWRAEGEKARVAVCARETLDEAEAFAAEYKFNPVSFVARPGSGEFSGEPFFSITQAAARLLAPGERIVPDGSAVPRQPKPKPDSAEAPAPDGPQAAPAPAEAPEDEPEPRAEQAEAPAAPPPLLDDPFAALEDLAAEFPEAPESETEDSPADPAEESPAARKRAKRDEAPKVKAPELAPFPPTPDEGDDLSTPRPFLPSRGSKPKHSEAEKPLPPAPKPAGAPEALSEAKSVPRAAPPESTDTKPVTPGPLSGVPPRAEAGPAPVAFSSKRTGQDEPPSEAASETRLAGQALRIGIGEGATPAAPAPSAPSVPPALSTPAAPSTRLHADMADALSRPLPRPGDAPEEPPSGPGLLTRLGSAAQGLKLPSRAKEPSVADTEADPAPAKPRLTLPRRSKSPDRSEAEERRAREAEALTVFGARQHQAIGGKPRYLGLILTLLLLLLIAIAVVWSSFFMGETEVSLFNPGPEIVTTSTETTASATPEEELAADPAAELAGDPATPAASEESGTEESLAAATPVTTVPATAEVLSPEAAAEIYSTSGIWQRAPEAPASPGALNLATPELAALMPVAPEANAALLPEASADDLADVARADPMPPPPPDTTFALDENGLVDPKPDGALSPAGILVYAGKPSLVPPARPADATPETTPESDTAAEADTADPAIDEAEPETPLIRPQPRPTDFAADSAALNDAATAAINAAVENAIESAFDGSTELAVATSLQPRTRPANFASIVDATYANASDGSVVVAAAAPATVAPAIPTSASVATRATMENALNLRKINLIGIYGSSTARRALVRLSNGRYVKVEVGDRLDGGKVTSITSSQLTYQKGSRSYTLDVLPLG